MSQNAGRKGLMGVSRGGDGKAKVLSEYKDKVGALTGKY
jgi:hypothetical protein